MTNQIQTTIKIGPSNDLEIENAVIGSVLLTGSVIYDLADILTEDDFYQPRNKMIWSAMMELQKKGIVVDMFTLIDQCRESQSLDAIGGPAAIAEIMSSVTSSANVIFYSRILNEHRIRRQCLDVGLKMVQASGDESHDAFDLLNTSEMDLLAIKTKATKRGGHSAAYIVDKTLEQLESIRTGGNAGIPCGLPSLTEHAHGWKKSDLIIIAARPGMGKTVMGMTAASIAVNHSIPVAIFSLEMSETQLMSRLISMQSGINNFRLQNGELHDGEWSDIQTTGNAIRRSPLFIDDTPALNVFDFRTRVRRLKMRYDIQLVVVDYLQLMRTEVKNQSREQEISTISRTLKQVAKEMDIPVIALAQLSRDIEKRPDKRPRLSDLRESGAIEQDADMIIFLNREPFMNNDGTIDNSSIHPAVLDIAKHRNGPLGHIALQYDPKCVRFIDNNF